MSRAKWGPVTTERLRAKRSRHQPWKVRLTPKEMNSQSWRAVGGVPTAPTKTVGQSTNGDGAQPSSPLATLGKPHFCLWQQDKKACHTFKYGVTVQLHEPAGWKSACSTLASPPFLGEGGPWKWHSRKMAEPTGLVLPHWWWPWESHTPSLKFSFLLLQSADNKKYLLNT